MASAWVQATGAAAIRSEPELPFAVLVHAVDGMPDHRVGRDQGMESAAVVQEDSGSPSQAFAITGPTRQDQQLLGTQAADGPVQGVCEAHWDAPTASLQGILHRLPVGICDVGDPLRAHKAVAGGGPEEHVVGPGDGVRGLGAHVLNIDGEQFCFPLEPRDVESAELIREAMDVGKGIITPTGRVGLWLDSPMIEELHGPGTVKKELPAKFIQFERHGIDISKEPMLVYPTLHYQNGGINVNGNSETVIPGLYAAGEAIGGVHGENRLMGNSLQDIITFGRRAGTNAAKYIQGGVTLKGLTLDHVVKFEKELAAAGIKDPAIAPILLPDYATEEVVERRWTEALTDRAAIR